MRRKILSFISLVIALMAVLPMQVFAQSVPDLNRTGSITVTLRDEGSPVPGGTLLYYQVGEVVLAEDGNHKFVLTDAFAGSGLSLDNFESPSLASKLASYAAKNRLHGTTVNIGKNGTAVMKNLKLGLYLIVQDLAAEGYEEFSPFLVSLPRYDGEKYVYTVDASPKVSVEPLPDEPSKPTKPNPPKPPRPSKPIISTNLPQTGQLNWPVPVLTLAGMFLLILGWILRRSAAEKGMD